MTVRIVIRSIAYLVVVGAFLATAIALNHRQQETANLKRTSPSTDEAALARCKALGRAQRDAACTAAWRARRERFLKANAVEQARASVPAASDPSGPASAGAFAAQANRAGQPQ